MIEPKIVEKKNEIDEYSEFLKF